jgi:ABC-type glycerol-3-phosphate transport system permease component
MVKTSMISDSGVYKFPPRIFISLAELDLHRYVRLAKESPLFIWVLNTLLLSIITTLAGLIVSLPAGYALSRFRSRTNKYLGYSLLITRMMPLTLLIVPMYMVLGKMKLLDNRFSIILSNLSYILPFTIWTLKSFIDGIPKGIDESAKIDGCSTFTTLTAIIFPLALPGVGAVIVYSLVRVWGEFLFANAFLTSPNKLTITVGAQIYAGSLNVSWGNIMAVTTVGSIPMMLLFLYLEKYFIGGLSAGAVKE